MPEAGRGKKKRWFRAELTEPEHLVTVGRAELAKEAEKEHPEGWEKGRSM